MSISDTNRHFLKTVIAYSMFTVLCVVTNKVYSLFSHGVSSAYMTYMFLYPLIGCGIIFIPLWIFGRDIIYIKGYRFFYNLYNSGISTLTFASLLQGIVIIAGTTTPYSLAMFIAGAIFITISLITLLVCIIRYKMQHESQG